METHKMSAGSKFILGLRAIVLLTSQVKIMKTSLKILFALLAASSLAGCNTMNTNDVASACEQGIDSLKQRLHASSHKVHQTNLSRANSLLIAARVQQQFAEYPGCLEKVKRGQDYLTGRQTAIISRLSI